MSNLKVFENAEFGEIRTLEENGKIYFCGSDVAKALGYSRPNDAISTHCRYTAKHRIPHPQSPDKQIEMSFIPEGDVYRLITHSKLPAAEQFEKWVFDEVLPTIRKTGSYSLNGSVIPPIEDPGKVASLINTLKSTMQGQNSTPFEIAAMVEMICGQYRIRLPGGFAKTDPQVKLY